MITIFTLILSIRPSVRAHVPTFQNQPKENKYPLSIGTVGWPSGSLSCKLLLFLLKSEKLDLSKTQHYSNINVIIWKVCEIFSELIVRKISNYICSYFYLNDGCKRITFLLPSPGVLKNGRSFEATCSLLYTTMRKCEIKVSINWDQQKFTHIAFFWKCYTTRKVK